MHVKQAKICNQALIMMRNALFSNQLENYYKIQIVCMCLLQLDGAFFLELVHILVIQRSWTIFDFAINQVIFYFILGNLCNFNRKDRSEIINQAIEDPSEEKVFPWNYIIAIYKMLDVAYHSVYFYFAPFIAFLYFF